MSPPPTESIGEAARRAERIMAMQAGPRSARVAGEVSAAGVEREPAGAASSHTGAMRGSRVAEKSIRKRTFAACGSRTLQDYAFAGVKLVHRHGLPRHRDYSHRAPFASAAELEGLGGNDIDAGPLASDSPTAQAARQRMGVAPANCTLAHDGLVCGRLVRPVVHDAGPDLGYRLLLPNTARGRTQAAAFHARLREELTDTASHFADASSIRMAVEYRRYARDRPRGSGAIPPAAI